MCRSVGVALTLFASIAFTGIAVAQELLSEDDAAGER